MATKSDVIFTITVNLGKSRQDVLVAKEFDSPNKIATRFCERNNLGPRVHAHLVSQLEQKFLEALDQENEFEFDSPPRPHPQPPLYTPSTSKNNHSPELIDPQVDRSENKDDHDYYYYFTSSKSPQRRVENIEDKNGQYYFERTPQEGLGFPSSIKKSKNGFFRPLNNYNRSPLKKNTIKKSTKSINRSSRGKNPNQYLKQLLSNSRNMQDTSGYYPPNHLNNQNNTVRTTFLQCRSSSVDNLSKRQRSKLRKEKAFNASMRLYNKGRANIASRVKKQEEAKRRAEMEDSELGLSYSYHPSINKSSTKMSMSTRFRDNSSSNKKLTHTRLFENSRVLNERRSRRKREEMFKREQEESQNYQPNINNV